MRLPDADGGEERPERDQRAEQRARKPLRDRAARDGRQPGREGEHEERERDAAGAFVPRPQERRGRQRHERRQREREQERRRRRSFACEDAVCERERGCRDHEVQRQEQECLLGAQLDGDTERGGREHGDRDDRGVARERDGEHDRRCGADGDERYPSRVVEEELDVLVSDERPGETARRRAEQPETDERKDPAARDQRADRAQRAQERGDLRELRVLHDRWTLRHE